jgi:uncharacterized protein GlcG (DUF336 family)
MKTAQSHSPNGKIRWLLSLPLICGYGATLAENLPQVSMLPLELAKKAVFEAQKHCEAGGYKVSVAVVDRSGLLQMLVRSDGAGAQTIDSSARKAYTSANLRESTQKFAESVAKSPELQGLQHINQSILLLGGGFPIKIGGEIVGGIGVGGAPGAALDEACARAGLAAIGADAYKSTP